MNLPLTNPFKSTSTPVAVLDENAGRRGMLQNAIKQIGYKSILVASSGKELVSIINSQNIGWIVGTLELEESSNLLQILAAIAKSTKFGGIFVSMFAKADCYHLIPKAYELGLLSHHPMNFSPDQILAALQGVAGYMQGANASSVEYAQNSFRKFLLETKDFRTLLKLEQKLSSIHASSPDYMFELAKAEILAGDSKNGAKKLNQLKVCFPNIKVKIDEFSAANPTLQSQALQSIVSQGPFDDLKTDILCSNSEITNSLSQTLRDLGVTSINVFSTFEDYKQSVLDGKIPEVLFFDWNIEDIDNVALIQRLKSIPNFTENIIIISEFIDPLQDKAVLKEFGIFGCIRTPFDKDTVGKEILKINQEISFPRSAEAILSKLTKAIKEGHMDEALALFDNAKKNKGISDGDKLFMNAQIEFANGQHAIAAKLTIESIRNSGDTITTLNFLGKCMMVLGKYDFAIDCFTKANELAPGSIERLCGLSLAMYEKNDKEGSLANLSIAKDLDPDSKDLIVAESTIDLREGNTSAAKEKLAKLKNHLGVGASLNNAAIANIRAEKNEEALELYEAAQGALPDGLSSEKLTIQYNYALALARMGKNINEIPVLLESVIKSTESRGLKKKAQSLSKRVNSALIAGTSINLNVTSTKDSTTTGVSSSQDMDSHIFSFSDSSETSAANKCLLGIFTQEKELDAETAKMLETLPKLGMQKV
ncbi:MAG: hypothetical protein NT027_06985 [Proteobacteria bacterium]|nr:hypothetical protein [Pseudomonadota bacterium]